MGSACLVVIGNRVLSLWGEVPDPGAIIMSMSEAIETPLRAGELAKILPLHPVTILKWAREGEIPHKRLGPRTIVFMPSEIRVWLESKNESYSVGCTFFTPQG